MTVPALFAVGLPPEIIERASGEATARTQVVTSLMLTL